MNINLLNILRSPISNEELHLEVFDERIESSVRIIISGLLIDIKAEKVYPIIDAVPIFFEFGFTHEFINEYSKHLSVIEKKYNLSISRRIINYNYSFSSEWKDYFKFNLNKTWGWTIEERVEQFFLETQIDPQDCRGKIILDAGCRNGQLTEKLTEYGATVIGLDFSQSVLFAEENRKLPNVHFLQGDIRSAPFSKDTFDIIISNGVLHHTSNTFKTFKEVSKLVKPNGRFYLWLYKKQDNFFRRNLFIPVIDFIRFFVSRSPIIIQKYAIYTYAFLSPYIGKLKPHQQNYSFSERIISSHDFLTCKWRHYHNPVEVASWFHACGFSNATLTHWDNPYGFGIIGTKKYLKYTPGVHYHKS